MKRFAAAALIALVAAVPALAADPSSGTISSSSPTVTWTGSAPGYGITAANILIAATGQRPLCAPNACDTFSLTLAETAPTLTVTAKSDSGGFIDVELVKPDGSTEFVQSVGADADNVTIKIKNAPAGAYTVNTWTNDAVGLGGTYSASASMAAAGAAPAVPVPGAAPDPGAAPPAGGPAPAPAATTITLKTKSASAKRSKKKLALAVSSSGPVTDVVASLTKGSKKLGAGKLAKLDGSGRITLKLKKKLKPGKYVVGVYGKDAGGGTVGGTTPLKVKK